MCCSLCGILQQWERKEGNTHTHTLLLFSLSPLVSRILQPFFGPFLLDTHPNKHRLVFRPLISTPQLSLRQTNTKISDLRCSRLCFYHKRILKSRTPHFIMKLVTEVAEVSRFVPAGIFYCVTVGSWKKPQWADC